MTKSILLLIFILLATMFAKAQEPIRDNSFLVEEAYNQDEGVIQHILTGQFDPAFKNADGSFTEEWPVGSILHQVSVTLPYRLNEGNKYSLNDLLLNYRYQLVAKDNIFIAPRCSFILPTGQSETSGNSGGKGIQFNIPGSFEVSRKITIHVNLGNTFLWYNENKSETHLKSSEGFSSGISLIYSVTNSLNFLFEAVHSSGVNTFRSIPDETESLTIINPGFRFAINFPSGLQIVPGLGIPYDCSTKTSSYFLYLSFEHPIKKKKS